MSNQTTNSPTINMVKKPAETQDRHAGVDNPFFVDTRRMSPAERLSNSEARVEWLADSLADLYQEIAILDRHLCNNRARRSRLTREGVSKKHIGLLLVKKQITRQQDSIKNLNKNAKRLRKQLRELENKVSVAKEESTDDEAEEGEEENEVEEYE